jgi:uncharacterized membrane protein YhhN
MVLKFGEAMIIILIACLIFAVLEWFFEVKEIKLGIYLTKPAMMILLISWVWFYAGVPQLMTGIESSSVIWFIIGLIFCLGGDVFLMFPGQFFLLGLISFLLGHICYIIGFGIPIPTSGDEMAAILITVFLLFLAGWVYVRLAAGMQVLGMKNMRIPVLFYTVVITIMLYSALMTLFNDYWNFYSSILVSVGAILFLVSDIMNAWARFVNRIPNHRLWIMSTYHLAQLCIAIGAVLHFSGFKPVS